MNAFTEVAVKIQGARRWGAKVAPPPFAEKVIAVHTAHPELGALPLAAASTYLELPASPKKVAHALGVDRSTVTRYRTGGIHTPLAKLADQIVSLERQGISAYALVRFLAGVQQSARNGRTV